MQPLFQATAWANWNLRIEQGHMQVIRLCRTYAPARVRYLCLHPACCAGSACLEVLHDELAFDSAQFTTIFLSLWHSLGCVVHKG